MRCFDCVTPRSSGRSPGTFLSALKAKIAFAGIGPNVVVAGILKHKIIDVFRRSNASVVSLSLGFTTMKRRNALSPRDWRCARGSTSRTERLVAQPRRDPGPDEFWNVFARCLGKLPEDRLPAFLMREMDDRKTDEICSVLGITQDNAWVMLHRARMALRRCLEKNWFCR